MPTSLVSIHAPAWGATQGSIVTLISLRLFQSTHPRGVRRIHVAGMHGIDDVSIHAPAWGATRDCDGLALRDVVSIHAPAWGAT